MVDPINEGKRSKKDSVRVSVIMS